MARQRLIVRSPYINDKYNKIDQATLFPEPMNNINREAINGLFKKNQNLHHPSNAIQIL